MVKKKLDLNSEEITKKIHKQLLENLKNYKETMSYMCGDAPIGVLCLPKVIEKILIRNNCLRVYDLFNHDLVKIKGMGRVRIRDLTTSLDQFLPMR